MGLEYCIDVLLFMQLSLVNYELSRDRTRVTAMSERVRPSHQGRGLSAANFPGFKAKLLEDFPNVTRALFINGMPAGQPERKFTGSVILSRWVCIGAYLCYIRFRPWLLSSHQILLSLIILPCCAFVFRNFIITIIIE